MNLRLIWITELNFYSEIPPKNPFSIFLCLHTVRLASTSNSVYWTDTIACPPGFQLGQCWGPQTFWNARAGFNGKSRADSRFAPSQWEMALLCNNVSHWLGANLESAVKRPSYQYRKSHCGDKTITMGFPILVRWYLYINMLTLRILLDI